MPNLVVDPLVFETMQSAVEYWQREATAVELPRRLAEAFEAALWRIGNEPGRGQHLIGLPMNYRRLRLARNLPGYIFFYRVEQAQILIFLLRHERQRPYTPATIRRKASEAAKRTSPPE